MKSSRVLYLLAALLFAALALVLLVSGSRAAGEGQNAPRLILAVDASGEMDDEIAALDAAWTQVFAPDSGLQAGMFGLIAFRDGVNPVGQTADSAEMDDWLSRISTQDDGNCLDNAFGALWAAARLAPSSHFSNTTALLLSDSAPRGGRTALAHTINLLAEHNVATTPVLSGWCPDAPLAPEAMAYLAAGSGGLPPLYIRDHITDVVVPPVLSSQTAPDVLSLQVGGGAQISDVHTIEVDATVGALHVAVVARDNPCDGPYAPPACPQAASPAATGGEPQLTVRLRDPQGKLLTGQTPGVSFSDVSGLGFEYYVVDVNNYPGPGVGAFSVEIEGLQSGYVMRASASSGVSANLLSGHTMAAGQAGRVVVGLLLPAGQQAAGPFAHPAPRPTEELFGAYNFYTGERVALDLRDDGLSGDGEAGDGIYGGAWTPQRGLWQLQVHGELADGSAFQRVEAAPIRVNRFGLRAPEPRRVMPGDNVTYQFALSNSGEETQTFELAISSSLGWAVTDTVPSTVTVAAGDTAHIDVQVVSPPGATEGSVEETALTAVVPGDDALTSATAAARTTAGGQLQLFLPLTVAME